MMVWRKPFTRGRIAVGVLAGAVLWIVTKQPPTALICAFLVSALFYGLENDKRKSGRAGTPVINAQKEELLTGLTSEDAVIRENTLSRMQSDGPTLVDNLHESLRIAQEQAGLQQRGHRIRHVGGLGIIATLLAILYASGAPTWIMVVMSAAVGSLFVFELFAIRRLPLEQQALIYALSCLEDPRSCPYLIDGAVSGRKVVRQHAVDALKRILPVMTEEAAQLVPDAKKSALYRQLLGSDASFVSAILASLPSLDDGGLALRSVERLASGEGGVGNDPQIRESAAALIPLLAARSERLHSGATLLREGSAPDDGSHVRPVYCRDASEPVELVRAANSSDTPDS